MPVKPVHAAAHYLAIDQGGHASRALLFSGTGTLIASAAVPIHTQHLAPQQVEHDAEEMIASLRSAIDEALRQAGNATTAITAGLASQRSSVVCWDRRDGRALSPIISWQDRRMAGWLQHFTQAEADIQSRTGLVLSPHYGASKLRWCLDHLPAVQDAFKLGRLACGPMASFLVARLTREAQSLADPANASRTLLFNLDTADWDASLLQLFGIPATVLPRCVPSRHRYGHIGTARGPLPLKIVTGDQAAALFGFGAPRTDSAYVNLGTGAFVQRPVSARPPASRLLTSLAYAQGASRTYVLEGTINGAGSALSWACAQLQMPEAGALANLPHWLRDETSPPLFINSVSGLGSPYWRPQLEPYFIGEGSVAAKLVAVIESIVFLIQANLDAMTATTGTASQTLVLSGGLAQLDGLCQALADLSGAGVCRPAEREASARGLAFLTADRPVAFERRDADPSFIPAARPELTSRYRLWCDALAQA